MKKIIIINGPNLNLLGGRENSIYGSDSLKDIKKKSKSKCKDINLDCFFCQSNNEGEIISLIHLAQKNYNGLIINPAAFTHTSVALLDALRAIDIPKIENQVDLKLLLSEWPLDRKLIYCDEKINCEQSIIKVLFPFKENNNKWGVLIGPEGGFSDSEKEIISRNKNVVSVSLGKRLLRSDTAITVSLFCVQQLLTT